METVDAGSIVGIVVVVLAVVAFIVVVIWMPMQIRREQRELEAERLKPIHTGLIGVAEMNDDGADRQALINALSPQTKVIMKRKQAGESGFPGISICLEDGASIGELPSDLGEKLSRELGLGHPIDASVSQISGGTEDNPTRNVQLILQRRPEK